jgi:hypothetical protein
MVLMRGTSYKSVRVCHGRNPGQWMSDSRAVALEGILTHLSCHTIPCLTPGRRARRREFDKHRKKKNRSITGQDLCILKSNQGLKGVSERVRAVGPRGQ